MREINEEQYERLAEEFINSIEDELSTISDIVGDLYNRAKDYEGYDFTEDLQIALGDLI